MSSMEPTMVVEYIDKKGESTSTIFISIFLLQFGTLRLCTSYQGHNILQFGSCATDNDTGRHPQPYPPKTRKLPLSLF